jgi:RNA polymerase sigma factor (sigma-70 family)
MKVLAPRSPDMQSTSKLVEACLQGDSNAWSLLIARYARLVHSIPVRHGLSSSEVDDVGQEVFLALAQHLHEIDDPERLPAWLITTARRLSWRTLQRHRMEQPLDDMLDDNDERPAGKPLTSTLPTPEELVAGWTRQEAIEVALARLGARCQELLTLIFLDPTQPSYEAISAQLDMPKGSIGPTRNRCLQQMRMILEGMGVRSNE